MNDMPQIVRLMQLDRDALGFIPGGGIDGLATLVPKGQILVARADHQTVGYVAWTRADVPLDSGGVLGVQLVSRVKIHQCCVDDRFRLSGIGRHLVIDVDQRTGCHLLECSVRDDLAANEFWTSVGFEQTGHHIHKTSGSRLNLYRRFGSYNLPEVYP